eukprot:Nk52_evm24s343 gene=Nk52_evmTU24s343
MWGTLLSKSARVAAGKCTSGVMRMTNRPVFPAVFTRAYAHKPGRFYNEVGIKEQDGGFVVTLDGRSPRTPKEKKPMVIPSKKLALLVAAEWQEQEGVIRPEWMHFTALCNTAIDCYAVKPKEDRINDLMEYLHTDTVLYRAEGPESLVEKQSDKWDPCIKWFNETYGINMKSTFGLFPEGDFTEDVNKVRTEYIEKLGPWEYIAVEQMVHAAQSMIIGLGLNAGRYGVEEAAQLCRLESEYQTETWGRWEGAHDIEYHDARAKLGSAAIFARLVRDANVE